MTLRFLGLGEQGEKVFVDRGREKKLSNLAESYQGAARFQLSRVVERTL